MNPALSGLECTRCHRVFSTEHILPGCPSCAADGLPANVATTYDLDVAYPTFMDDISSSKKGMSRYGALLPLRDASSTGLMAGGTPLIEAPRLADRLGLRRLWVKDESRNPTWSFKDRAAEVAAAHAKQRNSPALIVASTGNAAAATAAAANRVGLPAIVLFAEGVDCIMSAFVLSYGAMVVTTPTKKDRWALMERAVEAWDLYPCSNYIVPPVGNNPFMSDGYKSTGFEIWEQLGNRTPDYIFAPIGHADNLFGVHRAFLELEAMGLADKPRLFGGEVYGSLTNAIRHGLPAPEEMPTQRKTVAFSIGTAQSTYQAVKAIRESNGNALQVSDEEVLVAQHLLATTEGILAESTSASGLVALMRSLEEGDVDPDAEAVLICTSSGIKSLGVTHTSKDDIPVARDDEEFAHVLRANWGFEARSLAEKEE